MAYIKHVAWGIPIQLSIAVPWNLVSENNNNFILSYEFGGQESRQGLVGRFFCFMWHQQMPLCDIR